MVATVMPKFYAYRETTMMTFPLDPEAVLDYQFDWTSWLDTGETIASHTCVGTTGITVASSSEAAGVVTVWVSGATDRFQRVTCHITTSDGRQDDRTMRFEVRDR